MKTTKDFLKHMTAVLLLQLAAIGLAQADPVLLKVESRKTHGASGPFKLLVAHTVPLAGAITVEPRAMDVGHTLLLTFDTPIIDVGSASVVDANGAAAGTATVGALGLSEFLLRLTNIADNSRVQIRLTGVNGTTDFTISMGFLIGDVDSSGSVTQGDISTVKSRSGQQVTQSNFLYDINATGVISAADIAAVKTHLGYRIPTTPATLEVGFAGLGIGSVVSNPAGLSCDAPCVRSFNRNTLVTLTAIADEFAAFAGWGGDCAGMATIVQVVVTGGNSCTAAFNKLPQISLTVSVAGAGAAGSVSTKPGRIIDCSTNCTAIFVQGSVVTLVATPAAGSVFSGWSGACSGANSTVTIIPNANGTCTATFAPSGPIDNPILFVAQVPTLGDFTARMSTFGNHNTGPKEVVRGGDLMIRYSDGTLRNLTKEAGFGVDGAQVDTVPPSAGNNRPIAVREPSVHWSGTKAVFSLLLGAPPHFAQNAYFWQLYEVTGLAKGQTAVITKVPNQPTSYSNVSPIYGTDDRIIFTSDRPRGGQAHLYPQLDEYESSPTVTGIWSLNPAVAGGDLKLLTHTPSGAFTPSIDSFGRVIFTRWDHMQQDQQADVDRDTPSDPDRLFSYNFTDESLNSTFDLNNRVEVFPESRNPTTSGLFGGFAVNGYTSNLFTPWQINEDGTEEETLNHIGRQELTFGFIPRSFTADPNLSDNTNASIRANQKQVGQDTGLFHLREDPAHLGTYLGIQAREFGSLASNQIVKLTGGPNLNGENMVISDVTPADGSAGAGQPSSPGGRFRNPLPLVSGTLVASHTAAVEPDIATYTPYRLRSLTLNTNTGLYAAGPVLTGAGISKTVSWFSPDDPLTYSGLLWEIEAVEVVARTRPARRVPVLPTPESTVFTEVGVDPTAFRTWLANNNLSLIVTRNQTRRDRGDLQQPYNLRVPGGVSTTKPGSRPLPNGAAAYDIAHYQIFQGDQVRGYVKRSDGRRVIAQKLHDPVAVAKNNAFAPNPGGPAGSVKIAADGSTVALVPARRALAWQTTDPAGNAVVRERVWITTQPGEIRVCASCHGTNTVDQAGNPEPTNKPEALRTFLQLWKAAPNP